MSSSNDEKSCLPNYAKSGPFAEARQQRWFQKESRPESSGDAVSGAGVTVGENDAENGHGADESKDKGKTIPAKLWPSGVARGNTSQRPVEEDAASKAATVNKDDVGDDVASNAATAGSGDHEEKVRPAYRVIMTSKADPTSREIIPKVIRKDRKPEGS